MNRRNFATRMGLSSLANAFKGARSGNVKAADSLANQGNLAVKERSRSGIPIPPGDWPIDEPSGLPIVGRLGFSSDPNEPPEPWMLEPEPPPPVYELVQNYGPGQGFREYVGKFGRKNGHYPGKTKGYPARMDGTEGDFEGATVPSKVVTYTNSIKRSMSGLIQIVEGPLREDLMAVAPDSFVFMETEVVSKDGKESIPAWWLFVRQFVNSDVLHKYSFCLNPTFAPIAEDNSDIRWGVSSGGGGYYRHSTIKNLPAFQIAGDSPNSNYLVGEPVFQVFEKHRKKLEYETHGRWGDGNRAWHPKLLPHWPPVPIPFPADHPAELLVTGKMDHFANESPFIPNTTSRDAYVYQLERMINER